ncbi:MAG: RraA family protein [Actinobacteria bacterium]|nr:RraA family protein [Actinomycetota bacterium]
MGSDAVTMADNSEAAFDAALLDELSRASTPTIVNAMKQLGLAPHEIVTVDRSIRCISPGLGIAVGYAATALISSSLDPRDGEQVPGLQVALWRHIESMPAPRFLVVENVGDPAGRGCFWGEVQSAIHTRLHCRAGITNGPVRDVPDMEERGFQTFAGGVATGGAYFRYVEIGVPVEVGGARFEPGDLVHGDMHGVVRIPADVAPRLPEGIRQVEAFERRILDVCERPDCSVDALAALNLGTNAVKH